MKLSRFAAVSVLGVFLLSGALFVAVPEAVAKTPAPAAEKAPEPVVLSAVPYGWGGGYYVPVDPTLVVGMNPCAGCSVPCLPFSPSPTLVAAQGGIHMEYALAPSAYGMKLFRAGDFACAFRYFEAAYLSSGRSDYVAAYNAAVSALEMNRLSLASAWAQRALYVNPNYAPAWDLRIKYNLW